MFIPCKVHIIPEIVVNNVLQKQLPPHWKVMVRRQVPFGFDNPLLVLTNEVWCIPNRLLYRVRSIAHVFPLGRHLEVLVRESERVHEVERIFLVGKAYPSFS